MTRYCHGPRPDGGSAGGVLDAFSIVNCGRFAIPLPLCHYFLRFYVALAKDITNDGVP